MKSGVYWYKGNGGTSELEDFILSDERYQVLEVVEDGKTAFAPNCLRRFNVERMKGLWIGPIPQPEVGK